MYEKLLDIEFKNIDPKLMPSATIHYPEFKDHSCFYAPYIPIFKVVDMYKEEHTISLPVFGYYWRQFKNFFKKPFKKRLDRRHRLKHYDRVCKENAEFKEAIAKLEHEIWKKGVYLEEAHRLLKIANKDKG